MLKLKRHNFAIFMTLFGILTISHNRRSWCKYEKRYNIRKIISNYRLFNVNLDSSTLETDIDNLINDLEKINIYSILNSFNIDILKLQSIKEGKKLLEKYNTQKDIE